MQVFQNSTLGSFTLNNKKYVKNFLVLKAGAENVAVYNAFDSKLQLLPSTHYSEIIVNGMVYNSQTELMSALAPLLFVKQIVDSSTLSGVTSVNGQTGDVTIGLQEVLDANNAAADQSIYLLSSEGGGTNVSANVVQVNLSDGSGVFIDAGIGIINSGGASGVAINSDPQSENLGQLIIPDVGIKQYLPLAVNGQFADDNGNITLTGITTGTNLQTVLENGNEAVDSSIILNASETPNAAVVSAEGLSFSYEGDNNAIINPSAIQLSDADNSRILSLTKDAVRFEYNESAINGTLRLRYDTPTDGDDQVQLFRSKSGFIATEDYVDSVTSGLSSSLQAVLDAGSYASGHSVTLKNAYNSDARIDFNLSDFFEPTIKVYNGGAGSSGHYVQIGSGAIVFDGDGDYRTTLNYGLGEGTNVYLPEEDGTLVTHQWLTGNTASASQFSALSAVTTAHTVSIAANSASITANTVSITSNTAALATKLPIQAGTATGVTITFVTDRVYGTTSTPETGNISGDTTGALLGVTNLVIHNHTTTAPTFDSKFKKLSGSGSYVVNTPNYIYCQYINSTTILYSINQAT
jgi:hypothetical protein